MMKKYGKKIIKKFLILCLFALLIFSSIVGKIIHDAPEISPRKLLEEVRNMPYAIAYEEIPPKMIAATLAAEDHRFYQHHGIDYIRIIQAILYDIYYGKLVYGASTIPMQLSKNHFTGFEKTFRRKILDMYYATVIEKELTKEEILECYLNTIGLSKGIVVVREGAKTFFNRDANQLSTAECVYLIGITNWVCSGAAPLRSLPGLRFPSYDIGYGGVDHVLASGEDINILASKIGRASCRERV